MLFLALQRKGILEILILMSPNRLKYISISQELDILHKKQVWDYQVVNLYCWHVFIITGMSNVGNT